MCRWQNTIFGFLSAQLDFLAKFYTPPYNQSKICILNDSSEVNKLSKYCNRLYLIVILRKFYLQNLSQLFGLKKAEIGQKPLVFLDFGGFGPKLAKKRHFDQFSAYLSLGFLIPF